MFVQLVIAAINTLPWPISTLAMSKRIRGRSFEFARRVGRRPISDHLDFVSFVAGFDSLVAVVGRSHLAVLRRACRSDCTEMFRAEIDIFDFP